MRRRIHERRWTSTHEERRSSTRVIFVQARIVMIIYGILNNEVRVPVENLTRDFVRSVRPVLDVRLCARSDTICEGL